MEPGSTAGVLIWEILWAAPFASAARRAGGQLIADGRIPIQAIIASVEADDLVGATAEGAWNASESSTCRTCRCHRPPGREDRGGGQGGDPRAEVSAGVASDRPGSAAAAAGHPGRTRGVSDGTRTRDHLDHNQELYQLSYAHRAP